MMSLSESSLLRNNIHFTPSSSLAVIARYVLLYLSQLAEFATAQWMTEVILTDIVIKFAIGLLVAVQIVRPGQRLTASVAKKQIVFRES